MNKIILSLAIGLSLLAGCNAPKEVAGDDRSLDFTADWAFRLGDDTAAARPDYNDADWRKLNLPHDWAIEGPFRIDLDGYTGKLPWQGIGWYRKHFEVSSKDKKKRFYLDFDGTMANAEVWLNGKKVGGRPFGYSSFRVDLTPYVLYGTDNVVAVRLDTCLLYTSPSPRDCS